jgi:hypothetical protein
MKNLMLAGRLCGAQPDGTALAPAANAFVSGVPHTTYHSGPYDNTGHGPWPERAWKVAAANCMV